MSIICDSLYNTDDLLNYRGAYIQVYETCYQDVMIRIPTEGVTMFCLNDMITSVQFSFISFYLFAHYKLKCVV